MASYLIADLHLSTQRPDLIRAFCHFCQQISADANALYILGDFFEAWIGDDYQDSATEQVNKALSTLHQQGCQLYFMHGNRDFLVGQTFANKVGMQILESDQVYQIENREVILAHGDEYCWDDIDYQKFRRIVRSPLIQFAYTALPLSVRLKIANKARQKSKQGHSHKSSEIMDVAPRAITDAFKRHRSTTQEIDLMIHGHTHRPRVHDADASRAVRVVLGDWGDSLWFVKITQDNWQLVDQPIQ